MDEFERAISHVKNKVVSDEDKLKLYGWYKQAIKGDCSTAQPGMCVYCTRHLRD